MKDLPKAMEARVITALGQAVKLANDGMTPDEAITKVAEAEKFTPQIVQRVSEAFNISKTLNHLKKSAVAAKPKTFPLANPEDIIGSIWPKEPETAVKAASEALHTDYLFGKTAGDVMAADRIRDLPALTDKKPEAYAGDPGAMAKQAIDNQHKLWTLRKQAKDAYREMFYRLYGQVDKAAAYWRQMAPEVSFKEAEKRAHACFGEVGSSFMDLVYTAGDLGASRLLIKRADELPTTQMSFDNSKAPYDIINDAVFAAKQLTRLAKEAGEVEATMHEHAIANLDHLPPQPVEAAIDFFLPKEAEDTGMPKEAAVNDPDLVKRARPEKVSAVYRAIKRDHAGAPKDMMARIASSQGKQASAPLDAFVKV